MPLLFLLLILMIIYSGLFLYYRHGWFAVKEMGTHANFSHKTRFSIIIPARNESENIAACLSSIERLNYPHDLFEVIVVDDHSDDATGSIAMTFPFVRLISLKDHLNNPINSYKKLALSEGISYAKGDYIVTTDADCTIPPNWLKVFDVLIQTKQVSFIAAPVMIENKSGFLNKFETTDFMMLQAITASAVQSGLHVMSNGANLCFKKSAFEEVGGYAEIDAIASGDDMLLMQKIAEKYPEQILYCKSKEAIVATKGAKSISSFILQRIRWASKGKYYKGYLIKLILLFVYVLNFTLAIILLLSLYKIYFLKIFITAITIKTIIELSLIYPAAKFYDKRKVLWYYLPFQPTHILYMLIAGTFGNIGKYQWKGRIVR